MSNTVITLFYGSLLTITVLLAWQSKVTPWQKLAAWLSASWMATSISYYMAGPRYTPFITPALDFLVVVNIGALAMKYRSKVAWLVVGLFLLTATIPVAAFAGNNQGSIAYFGLENIGFVMRLLVVGGASALAIRARHRRSIASWHRASRASGLKGTW